MSADWKATTWQLRVGDDVYHLSRAGDDFYANRVYRSGDTYQAESLGYFPSGEAAVRACESRIAELAKGPAVCTSAPSEQLEACRMPEVMT